MELTPNLERGLTEKSPWQTIASDPWKNLSEQYPGLEKTEELQSIKKWYDNAVSKLPDFELEESPLEGQPWNAIYSFKDETRGQVNEIRRYDSDFFRLIGGKCIKKDTQTGEKIFEWTQPLLLGKETPLTVKLFGKEVEVPVYGLFGVIKDSKGNYLVAIGQEATSENKKHSIVRLPVQTSASKASRTIAGDPGGDKSLAELMKIYDCHNMNEVLKKAEDTLLESPEDPDRMLKHSIVMVMPAIDTESDMHRELVADGTRTWVSKEQFEMLALGGLTNSHTVICVDLAEKSARMRKFSLAK